MKKKVKKKKVDGGKVQDKTSEKIDAVSEEKHFGFGGLPERNLKKSLGC
jgi:hypothetical protein